MLGISQGKLAEKIGVTFQQIQKYEAGTDSLSASKIYNICNALGISVDYLFEKYNEVTELKFSSALEDFNKNTSSRELLEIMKSFKCIKDKVIRKRIIELIHSLRACS